MNMEQNEPTREEIIRASVQLGTMIARGQADFYDVVEGIAAGYAIGRDTEPGRPREILVQIGALDALQASANTVIEWRVEDARAALVSWSDIGDAMDMTKQAAQQRFGKKP